MGFVEGIPFMPARRSFLDGSSFYGGSSEDGYLAEVLL